VPGLIPTEEKVTEELLNSTKDTLNELGSEITEF